MMASVVVVLAIVIVLPGKHVKLVIINSKGYGLQTAGKGFFLKQTKAWAVSIPRFTLYNVILRIAWNFLETRENIKISTHPSEKFSQKNFENWRF